MKKQKNMFNHALLIMPRQPADFGAGVMNQRNMKLASAVSMKQTTYEIIPTARKGVISKFAKYIERAIGYLSDLSKEHIDKIENMIQNNPSVDVVFVMTSRWGLLAKRLKKKFPKIKLAFFFHNAEYVYAQEEYKVNKTFKNFLYIYYFRHVEKLALRCSDYRLVLSKRDDGDLKKIVPKVNNFILPMSTEDMGKVDYQVSTDGALKLLFVGSCFFANVEGLRWFAKNVMPYVKAELTVAGRGMEILKDEIETSNIQVFGRVDSLKNHYQTADVVVSPVFSGSGMKTKTAEALMYGMPIIGTEESFSGYDSLDSDLIGKQCDTAEEFIQTINYLNENRNLLKDFANNSRSSYEKYYSFETSCKTLREKLNNI